MASEQQSAFGVQLRRFREAAGLSQEELAERAGLTANAISGLERGARRRPYPHTVQLLAAALELDETGRAALIASVPKRSLPISATAPSGQTTTSVAPVAHQAHARLTAIRSPLPNLGHSATAFVGRQGELMALHAKLAEAFAGQGGIVMLVGEAGIGKTRLAREFAGNALSEGAVVLRGCCFEGDWQPPYGPWVEAFGSYARTCSAEQLRRQLGASAAPIARLVPEVQATLPDLPTPSPLSPDEERFRLYDAIIRFLLAVASEQPVLLILDDLHWADPDSLRLLRHVARFVGQARVLLVGAYRDPEFGLNEDHPLISTLTVLRRESDYERIAIQGFRHDEVAEYLAQTAGQPLPGALVRVIEEETSGNPFYAREVFRHLTEEAKLLQRDGRWTTDLSIRELGIPEGVRQVVGRRVARLSEQTGMLLRLASGFSGGFGFDVLQPLSELPEQVLLDCLDEALHAGLIRASAQVRPRYEFAHAIVRHALYEGLNFDRRSRLHRRIALALEKLSRGGGSEAAELAWQYYESAALPGAAKGIPHALRAAEQARAAYSRERAAGFLRMARDLASESPPGEQADILCRLAIAEADAVELENAQRSVKEALEAMNAAGVGQRTEAEFLAAVAQALKDGGATTGVWEPLVERGLALVGDQRDLTWARLALLQDHFEYLRSGPIGGARWLGQDLEAATIARAEGNEEDYSRTLDPLGFRTPNDTEAILALARSWSRPVAIMRALDVAGRDLLYRHGAFREGLAVYQELLSVSERFGSIPKQAEALLQMAVCQLATGNPLPAQETFHRGQEVVVQLGPGHRLHLLSAGVACALAYFLGGDWQGLAEMTMEYAISTIARHSPLGLIVAADAAVSFAAAGNTVAGHALLQHLTSIIQRVAPTTYVLSLTVTWAAVAVWELEAKEYAPTYRRLTLDMLSTGAGDPPSFSPLELFVARMSTLLGDFDEAEDYFERARSKVEALGLTHVRPIVDYDQACVLVRAGAHDTSRIVALLDSALEGFRSLGMLGWERRAVEQKGALTTSIRSSAPAGHDHPAGLTDRELEVLRLLAAGLTNREISARLVLSIATVERHVANIYGKIGASRRYEAVAFALKHDLGADPGRELHGIPPYISR